MTEIKRIHIPFGPSWEVGIEDVGEIKDFSLEYEDHIYSAYDIYDNQGKLIARLENVGVVIEYVKEK